MRARAIALACALILTTLVLAGTSIPTAGTAAAATNTSTFQGSGWTLTLTYFKSTYRSLRGTLTHGRQRYHVEGDWIPAADAGGDLLRVYGKVWPGRNLIGLVSVATLYNTCTPNCAAGKTFALKALQDWTLPGSNQRRVNLVVR